MDEMKAVIIQIQECLGVPAATSAARKRLQLRTSAIRRKKIRSLFVWLCLFCLCIGTAAISAFADDAADSDRNAVPKYIHLPVTEPDATTSSGVKTTWSCVWFGSYPSEEVVDSSWAAVDDYALADDDVIRDDKLYKSLTEADWKKDDTVILNGVSYLRVKSENSSEQESSREQHYHWDDDHPWHFFQISPMRWRVLDFSEGKMLLLADRMPDSMPFHDADEDVTWEDSTLRSWLNGTAPKKKEEESVYGTSSFLETAFTEEERAAIVRSVVPNSNNHYFGTGCGSGTRDRVFLLSEEETFSSENAMKYGFRPSDAVGDTGRRILPTSYATARGAWQSDKEETSGIGFWLLRTNGYTEDNVVYVGEKGYLYNRGIPVTCADTCIVPAIRVELDRELLTVTEDIKMY